MSETSPTLSLPYIQAAQAQKHVTHNEALRILDCITQLSIENRNLTQPPLDPQIGATYVVAADGQGEWAGHTHEIAHWGPGWVFYTPQPGWQAWDIAAGTAIVWTGSVWETITPAPQLDNLPGIGVNASFDATNRLISAADATLLTHDTTGSHQLKINKSDTTDTASLLLQSNWSGHAEIGLIGSNDLAIKTSADGATFHTALQVDAQTGKVAFPNGIDGLSDGDFGDTNYVTVDYMSAKGVDLFTNGAGLLGNTYNFPDSFTYDDLETPNLPGAMTYSGYYTGVQVSTELLPVDPNLTYRISCYLRQESADGDFSTFPDQDRHTQFMGLMCFDRDKRLIVSTDHMRYKHNGIDSLTTLTAPLTPGDTVVHLASTDGWNMAGGLHIRKGIIIFEYKDSVGKKYDYYSRLWQFDLFEPTGIDTNAHTITLKTPFPNTLANPDHPDGTWPIGTRIANTNPGSTYKYSLLSSYRVPQTDTWYKAVNYMGGIDASGENITSNFVPGTTFVKVFWLPNYSNRSGGNGSNPDTGPDHRILFSGLSVLPATDVATQIQPNGSVAIKVLNLDYDQTTPSLVPASLQVQNV